MGRNSDVIPLDHDGVFPRYISHTCPSGRSLRHPWQWRDVPAQRSELVAVLRIYRQYLIRFIHKETIQQKSRFLMRNNGNIMDCLRHLRHLRLRYDRHRLDIRRCQFLRRSIKNAVPFHTRNADVEEV